jgi:hypothetical protein
VRRLGRRAKERSARRGAPAKASQGEPGSEAQGSDGLYTDGECFFLAERPAATCLMQAQSPCNDERCTSKSSQNM